MRQVLLVAGRELRERLRSRVFLITNIGFLVVIFGGMVIGGLVARPSTTALAVVEGPATAIAELAAQGGGLELTTVADRAAAEAAVVDGEVDAALVSPEELVVERDVPRSLDSRLAGAAQQLALVQVLEDAGLSAQQVSDLLTPPELTVTALEEVDAARGPAFAVGVAAVFFLYVQLILYGQWVAQGVVEEKSSRIVEVLVATVSPARLLAGKILGLGGLGFATVALVAVVAAGGLTITDTFTVPSEAWGTLAAAVGWYVLGYTLYATLFATAGALVSRVEDLSSAMMPGIIVLVASFFLAQLTLNDPFSPLALVGALLPFSAPMIQPLLLALGALSPWMVLAGIVSTVAATVLLLPLAARIYTGGVLRTSGRVRLAEAWRSGGPGGGG